MSATGVTRARKVVKVASILVLINAGLLAVGLGIQIFRDRAQVLVNNLGFFPDQEKSFFVVTEREHAYAGTFTVVDSDTGGVVYSGNLTRLGWKWGRFHWLGNFSSLTTPGRYHVEVRLGPFRSESHEFTVDPDYFDPALRTSVYWYYYQRCGVSTSEIVPGYPGHPACHLQDAWYLYKKDDGTYEYRNDLNLTGGWHDSGDYNVYSVRMAKANYALLYAYDHLPGFFNRPEQASAFPEDPVGAIPDVVESAYFGLQWWTRRWYPRENRFFDSNMLGANGSIRWTVFCPPEYEDQFGDGRWVANDDEAGSDDATYKSQFVRCSSGLLVAGTYAAMARVCRENGWYAENVTQFESMANLTRLHYGQYLANDSNSLICETEMYKLTGNQTYFLNAQHIAFELLGRYNDVAGVGDDFLTLGFVLGFAQEYRLESGLLDYILGNSTLQVLGDVLAARTTNTGNVYNFLYDSHGKPAYNNAKVFDAQLAASVAANLTSNSSLRDFLKRFVVRQFDWLLGRNVENLCQIEGVPGGENPVFENHHRYKFSPGVLRGACPGWVLDGFEYFPGEAGEKNA
ncbi:MAG: glycoside hydrolase family 9 protein, partial [Promethearchaeota archaeon]